MEIRNSAIVQKFYRQLVWRNKSQDVGDLGRESDFGIKEHDERRIEGHDQRRSLRVRIAISVASAIISPIANAEIGNHANADTKLSCDAVTASYCMISRAKTLS